MKCMYSFCLLIYRVQYVDLHFFLWAPGQALELVMTAVTELRHPGAKIPKFRNFWDH